MRQIILDTETTGLLTTEGHRIIEIGCVELIGRQFTGNNFHYYFNPERSIEAGALEVHGITNEFLANKPKFAEILDEFLQYIAGAELIAHNAEFDVGFINHEMRLSAKKKKLSDYATVVDSLAIARKLFPGQRNSLDALCKRLQVDASERKLHGALLDAHLLAKVYLLMTGGQTSLFGALDITSDITTATATTTKQPRAAHSIPIIKANHNELTAHQQILEKIKKQSGKCVWDDPT